MNTVNLFLIYSPLHYLAAEKIANDFEPDAKNYLFYLKDEFAPLVNPANWTGYSFLPWPRFYPEKGFMGRSVRTLNNLKQLECVCQGAGQIRLHAPVIDTEAINYFINYLKPLVGPGNFSVRLIPDGLLNTRRHPMGCLKESLQYLRKLRKILFRQLDYYTFRGDRTGSDDVIIDKIYVLPRFPHQYDLNKVVELSELVKQANKAEQLQPHIPRALVIGQPLVDFKRMTQEHVNVVTNGIRSFIQACGIQAVDYKAHPKDRYREYDSPEYQDLRIDKPLEVYLAENQYDLVIGVCSTALLTARLILPESTRIVAYGMNLMEFRNSKDLQEIGLPFVMIGVEIIDA